MRMLPFRQHRAAAQAQWRLGGRLKKPKRSFRPERRWQGGRSAVEKPQTFLRRAKTVRSFISFVLRATLPEDKFEVSPLRSARLATFAPVEMTAFGFGTSTLKSKRPRRNSPAGPRELQT